MNLRRLLFVNAYQVYLATLHGCEARVTSALRDLLTDPRPGHLVMEVSTIYYPDRDEARFGRLVRKVSEPAYTREAWMKEGGADDESIPTVVAWYIEKEDGSQLRWTNASFIRVLEDTAFGLSEMEADRKREPLWMLGRGGS